MKTGFIDDTRSISRRERREQVANAADAAKPPLTLRADHEALAIVASKDLAFEQVIDRRIDVAHEPGEDRAPSIGLVQLDSAAQELLQHECDGLLSEHQASTALDGYPSEIASPDARENAKDQ